ncbi:recombinase family protein [Paenibacillus protaetiae]|nr:recombinase family protein [Paenibacillus protaetiae]
MSMLNKIIQPGMKGAFYGRHSTDKQTMSAQRSMAYEFAKKYDCTIVCEYEDAGVSARKTELNDREGINALLKDAIDRRFDFVVVNHHDRIARNPAEHQRVRMILASCAIPVVISNTDSLYDSGDFIVDLIKDGTSKFEVDNTRMRTRDVARTILKEGKWTGGKAPFGYRYDKTAKTFSQCTDEVAIVLRVYELYRKQEGFQSIATRVSHETGKRLNKSLVREIITNPFYAGYLTHHRKQQNSRNSLNNIENWEMVKSHLIHPIMTLEEWQETWTIYEHRKSGDLSPKMYKTSFFLSNLISCTVCEKEMCCKDQITFDSKRKKHYGAKWYCCTSCNYKIEAQRIHAVFDAIVNDLKTQNLVTISSLIYDEVLKDREKIAEQLLKKNSEVERINQLLIIAQDRAKKRAALVPDLETNDGNTKMVRILTIQQHQMHKQISELNIEIDGLRKIDKYFALVEGNPQTITSNIQSMSLLSSNDHDHDIRKMITYLVKQAVFTPIKVDSKNVIIKGDIAIQTRSSLIRAPLG